MPNLMTEYTKQRLEKELAKTRELKKRAMILIGEMGGSSDWHDNFALDQANRDCELFSEREKALKTQLRDANLIRPPVKNDFVEVGCRVVVDIDGKQQKEVVVLGEADAGIKPGWVSYKSPLGRKLLGKNPQEEFHLKVNGKTQWIKVVTVSRGEL